MLPESERRPDNRDHRDCEKRKEEEPGKGQPKTAKNRQKYVKPAIAAEGTMETYSICHNNPEMHCYVSVQRIGQAQERG